jgi:hypothetical protein
MEDAAEVLAALPRRLSDIAMKWAAARPDAPALFERGRVLISHSGGLPESSRFSAAL